MAMHLFSTPVECPKCGTVVDDPTIDKCPTCGNLLKERRTPGRLAGVERRYGNIRFLLAFLRFLAVITLLLAALLLIFGDASVPWTVRAIWSLGAALFAVTMLVVAAMFDVALDLEENTRATFRVQQQMLEALQGESPNQDSTPST
jgi:uncharacterized paraquat-inducible protein A